MLQTLPIQSLSPTPKLGVIVLAPGGVRLFDAGEALTQEMLDAVQGVGLTQVIVCESEEQAESYAADANFRRVPWADLPEDQAIAGDIVDDQGRVLVKAGTAVPQLQRDILMRIGIETAPIDGGMTEEQEALVGKALLRLNKIRSGSNRRRSTTDPNLKRSTVEVQRLPTNHEHDTVLRMKEAEAGPDSARATGRGVSNTRVIASPGRTGRTAPLRITAKQPRKPLSERLKRTTSPQIRMTTASEELIEAPPPEVPAERLFDPAKISPKWVDEEIEAGGESGLEQRPEGDPLLHAMLPCEPLSLRPKARIDGMLQIHESVVRGAEQIFAQIRMNAPVDHGLIAGLCHAVVNGLVNDQNLVLNLSGIFNSRHYLVSHSINTVLLSVNIGAAMGFSSPQVAELAYGALLHDVGMARIAPEIVFKETALTREEQLEIRRHPVIGIDLLQKFSLLPKSTPLVVYQENERLDGTGYPKARKRTLIHTYAKIVMVASTFDSLCAERPYRAAMLPYHAKRSFGS